MVCGRVPGVPNCRDNMRPRVALCIISKGSDDESVVLDRCLRETVPYIEKKGIFVTITQKNEQTEKVAKYYGANVSFFKWNDDYSAARNFNFSQVPKRFTHILWMDVDDLFRGLENLEKILADHPDTDAFMMNYLYWFDENKNPTVVHLKTQVVKNDGCVKWAGRIHEDLMTTRVIGTKMIKNIERIHLSTHKRLEESMGRNLRIAKKQIKENPLDPRNWFNLAKAQAALQMPECLENLKKFIGLTKSDDEKYLARLGIADYYFVKREFGLAMESTRYAIGLKPDYPDAYIRAGNIYFEMKDFHKAKDFYMMSLQKKPPVYQIIVYNPRDYDYVPLMALAKTYFNLSLPTLALEALRACIEIIPEDKKLKNLIKIMDEEAKKFERMAKHLKRMKKIKDKDKLRSEMDKLPDEVKSHPAVCNLRNINFVKTETSGKDLVFYCGYTAEEWTPDTAKEKGIGGSEEAVILLSKELTKKGWNVTVYNHCGYKEQEFDGVTYKPFWSWNYRDKQDVVVIWRHPKPCDYPINAKKVYLDLHDVVLEGEFTEERMKRITKILVKSKAHRDLFPKIPDEKFVIIPNGIDLTLFEKIENVARNPYYIINMSSPDRALNSIMEILVEVRKRIPKKIAKKMMFAWYYGWGVFDSAQTSEKEQEWKQKTVKRFEELKKEGWVKGGYRISHEQVAEEFLSAGALFYPSEFYEIDYVGGTKAQIAGCVPITTDFSAMNEKIQFGIKLPSEKTLENWANVEICDFGVKSERMKKMFINALVDYLKNPHKWDRQEMSKWAKNKYNITRIAGLWDEELSTSIPHILKTHEPART